MLVLTRKVGEKLVLTKNGATEIVITVTHIKGGSVRIGIDAPDWINIVRHELVKEQDNGPTSNGG